MFGALHLRVASRIDTNLNTRAILRTSIEFALFSCTHLGLIAPSSHLPVVKIRLGCISELNQLAHTDKWNIESVQVNHWFISSKRRFAWRRDNDISIDLSERIWLKWKVHAEQQQQQRDCVYRSTKSGKNEDLFSAVCCRHTTLDYILIFPSTP